MNRFRTIRGALAAAVCLLAVPLLMAACAAPAQSSDDGELDTIKGYLVDAFERAKAWDVSLAQAIPDSAMAWAPNPDVRGFAAQVIHAANNAFIGNAALGEEAPAFGDADALARDKAALVSAVTSGYDWIIGKLRAMPSADLAMESEFFGQTMPRWRVHLFALEHAMWTRGQLVPYLHANGVEVPQQRLF